MGDKNVDMSNGGPGSSRWNPTKEQITMLEGLYGQGIRTPSAEQIQQITSRLRAYGHIEGKNVFYWFQNHKARQRQKQKQESMVYVNRFFHKAAPVLVPSPPASCNNVVCSPFYIPNGGVGFYPHYPRLLLPGGIRRSPGMDKVEKPIESGCSINAGYALVNPRYDNMHAGDSNEELIINTISGHQTLPLFPLQPTGILEGRSADSFTTTSAKDSNPSSSSDTTHPAEEDSGVQPFFDFFSEH